MATSGESLPVRGDKESHTPDLKEVDSHSTSLDLRHVERAATWKIDFVVVPIVGLFYLLSFLDRANVGNARVAGLQTDLKMTDHQYSTALTVTYVPYIVMELPMNLLMKRLGANITLPLMVTLWGMVTACQGAVKTYGGLLACRFFLGALEGGLFPGIVLYLSTFYKRHAMQLRFSCMYSMTSLAGAFSGLLAAAIENMDGLRGLRGWAWIFVLEGLFTACVGVVGFFIMPATPADMPFLSEVEKSTYIESLAADWSGDAYEEEFSWSEVWSVFVDAPQILLGCLPLFFNGVTLFGLANFTPTIVSALGFSTTRTQLLTVPPYACAFVTMVICSYFSDKYKTRGLMAVFVSLVGTVGFAIFLGTPNKHANYGALFLQIVGIYSAAPCLSTWLTNNAQPHYRRATAVALAFMSTNVGGILSTWIFIDPPRFHIATSINLAFALGMAVVSASLVLYLTRKNHMKRAMVTTLMNEKGLGRGEGEWDSDQERRRLGDRHPRFEYTL
ncbi:MFS general substrate transporter [Stereum hirsutum FP-91666 SS1]|uniref:MFS general substrate transporter n=1 Tax=Stereum hirsutum (strain FP-91666) TaxID=721885 RepID=UPI0004449689|nr:MFS general substrate transporter [Stereum hirsutum FP-91666 SS1]EIM82651.1 MFS general substrate transporter [Stereum hirsutum FP-91666 SS1]